MNAQTAPASPAPFDIVALVTSAGGLDALSSVLSRLPPAFAAAVVVGQHLGSDSTLAEILARRIALPVAWIRDGESLAPGRVHVCPPHKWLEILPDHTCTVHAFQRHATEGQPLDRLLASLAGSCGSRGLAIVLTGMGSDGAAGARAVCAAGGSVIVQSVASAAYGEMPRAAIEGGAADLVLPLADIGKAVAAVVAGTWPDMRPGEGGATHPSPPAGELLALVPVGVYACDAQGRFEYWNRRAAELWGAHPRRDDRAWALCGAPRVIAAGGQWLAPESSPMQAVLRTGIAVVDRELAIVRADGARREILVNIRPLRDAEGRVVGAVNAFLDITARRQAERSRDSRDEERKERIATHLAVLAADLRGAREQPPDDVRQQLDLLARLASDLLESRHNAPVTGEGETA